MAKERKRKMGQKPDKWTTNEAMRKLFGTKITEAAKKVAHEKESAKKRGGKASHG